jgi:trehalose 6-phosphate synthase
MKTVLISNRVLTGQSSSATAGGLAAALYASTVKCGGSWIGAGGEATATPDKELPIKIRSAGAGQLVTVDFPAKDYRNFYNGMANSALWPILHDRPDLLRYEAEFLDAYRAINEAMAGAVCRVADPESLFWVHDYHFFMLGAYLRRMGVTAPIGFFLHTPFPAPSILACLPPHREIMASLAAYDLLGFQTDADLLHFQDYAMSELGAIRARPGELCFDSHRVKLGVYPVGIDVERFAEAAERASRSRKLMRMKHDLGESKLVIGVDRLDYSKGLPLRFRAYERFLTTYPDESKRVSFLQITPPTRCEVESYRCVRAELAGMAGDINARFGGVDGAVLRYINDGFPPAELAGFYRLAKAACVTPLRDGMNLVAKEYVACQDPDDPGVLVLSTFAGAARALDAAVLVNPYDVDGVVRGLHDALHMARSERIERWGALMAVLRAGILQRWYDSFLVALRTTSIVPAYEALQSVG